MHSLDLKILAPRPGDTIPLPAIASTNNPGHTGSY